MVALRYNRWLPGFCREVMALLRQHSSHSMFQSVPHPDQALRSMIAEYRYRSTPYWPFGSTHASRAVTQIGVMMSTLSSEKQALKFAPHWELETSKLRPLLQLVGAATPLQSR